MANSYSQVYIHYVFAVKGRYNLIKPEYDQKLQKYMAGIVKNNNCKLIAINNMPDHFHLLINLNNSISVSELIQKIKASSSKFINEQGWFAFKFSWQIGYGAFSYSNSQIKTVFEYIKNQKEHHKKQSFRQEYVELLNKLNIDWDEKYLFEFE